LVTTYGIAACCVVPLVTAQQQCIGTLAVVDVQPRSFSQRDVSFLAMAARWGMAEYERTLGAAATLGYTSSLGLEARSPTDTIRLGLISQLVQDLRSPLTAVLGMADMLSREIYGPLTKKQREYTDIVRRSSQTLMAQVAEILELGAACSEPGELVPTAVDITGLGEQVVATLTPMADKLAHTLTLTSEPGEHLWILDQRTVKQIFYHSLHSLIETASENSTIRLHTARKGSNLALTLWVSNPWMGDGLPPAVLRLVQALSAGQYLPNSQETSMASTPLQPTTQPIPSFRNGLGLVLSQSLARHHGGQMQLHGNAATGHRLVIGLPALKNVGIPSTMG
jgi:signal transduction histidine kinase